MVTPLPEKFIRYVRKDNAAKVKNLVTKQRDLITDKYYYDQEERTPLHIAVCENSKEVVHVLLIEGANFDSNIEFLDLLHIAADRGYPEILQQLINSLQSNDQLQRNIDVHTCYAALLRSACMTRHNKQCIRILLNAGAGVNEQDDEGKTPLHLACAGDESAVVKLLLEFNADPTIEADMHPYVNIEGGRTPMFYAMAFYRVPVPPTDTEMPVPPTDTKMSTAPQFPEFIGSDKTISQQYSRSIPTLLLNSLSKEYYREHINEYLDYACKLRSDLYNKTEGRLLVSIILDHAENQLDRDAYIQVVQEQIKTGNMKADWFPELAVKIHCQNVLVAMTIVLGRSYRSKKYPNILTPITMKASQCMMR